MLPARATASDMSASAASSSKIKKYWELFFASETGTYEKSTWLDLLLAEFMVQLKEGVNPRDIITFCPVSGVVTLVACELLCGIHRVTSSIHTQYTPPASLAPPDNSSPDAMATPHDEAGGSSTRSSLHILQKYLLKGTAWRCLVLLGSLGVEGLSCGRQLCSALVWLCGELSAARGVRAHGANPHLPRARPRPQLHTLFSNKIWMKQKIVANQVYKSSPGSDRQTPSRAKRKLKMEVEDNSPSNKLAQENQTSDSENPNDDLQVLNRTLTVKARVSYDDFQYFESPIKVNIEEPDHSLYEDPFYTPKKHKPKPEDFINDKHREIIDSEITPFEFNLIMIDLLQALCKAECNTCGSEGLQISVQCINFSLRHLCALQFGSSPVSNFQYSTEEISHLKSVLTELLIISLDKVLVRADLSAKVINNGIMPMLLRLLEDVTYKLTVRLNSKSDKSADSEDSITDKAESLNIVKFVFGIGYSITAFFFCLLMQCRSLEKLRDFTEQFKLYGECQKGSLLKQCIVLILKVPGVVPEVSVPLAKKLIVSIGRLVSGMKRVRSEVVHSATCTRSKHKACRERVAAGMHHHHRILGEAGTWLGVSPACCVSLVYGVQASLLVEDAVCSRATLRNALLRVMVQCGACCCFPPACLVENIVRLTLTHGGVASACLLLLERTVYGELGASVLNNAQTDRLPCATCERIGDSLLSFLKADDNSPECAVSPVGDSVRKYYSARDTAGDNRGAWAFLIHYNSLLQLDNNNSILHATVGHILRVTPKCKLEMKCELLFSVIYPTFIVAKHRYMIRREDAAYFLTVSCLNIFATLLNTVPFAEQFIQKGGLSYVLELVSMSEFSKQCCSILEIAVIVEIWKMQREDKSARGWREVGSLSSLRMMIGSLEEVTVNCYKVFKAKLLAEDFVALTDLSRERNAFRAIVTNFEKKERLLKNSNSTSPAVIHQNSATNNEMSRECESRLEVLKNVWTFWKTSAGLCLYSPYFRKYIVNHDVFLESYGIMKVLLFYLCKCECSAAEVRIVIKVLESLLTIQFTVSDVTMNKSKELTMERLREVLLSAVALSRDDTVLESACEMLVRVATTSASDVQVYPPHLEAKLPPLMCSEESSPESSAEDDEDCADLAGPYASEASEPSYHTADDGYEADVEVSRMDCLVSRRASASSGRAKSTDSAHNANADSVVDCKVYTRTGSVSHPELCVLVVDILTQLIHKLAAPEMADETARRAVGAACVSLARACCSRLSAARLPLPLPHEPGDTVVQRLLAVVPAAHRDPQIQELQRSILEIVHVLASQSILPSELECYLKLFAAPAPPLDILLPALARLVDTAEHNMPDFILTFPVQRYTSEDADMESIARDYSNLVLNSLTSQSQQAEELARRFNDHHLRNGISSPWCCCGVRCGVEGVNWGVWMQGFSATLWLRPQNEWPAGAGSERTSCGVRGSDDDSVSEWGIIEEWREAPDLNEKCREGQPKPPPAPALHLLSVGHESLVLEMWLHVELGSLTFKLSRPESKANKVLSSSTIDCCISSHRWNFVAFNVKDIVQKRKIHIQITLYVNARECETAILPVQGILVRAAQPTCLLLGHSVCAGAPGSSAPAGGGVYHLTGLSLFRAPLLTNYNVLYMMAHGPNATVFNNCQVGYQAPNFASLITPELLASNIDWDQVYEMSANSLRDVQDGLLLMFSAQSPTIMNLYHQTVSLPTVFSGRAHTGRTGALAGTTAGNAATIPETLLAVWSGAALPGTYRGVAPVVYMLGGPDVLLYLFARVVELDGTAEERACALSILLRVAYADNRLYSVLCEGDCLSMLQTIFAAEEFTFSHHILKALLDAACSAPVLTVSGDRYSVLTDSDAVLVEPKLLVTVIRAWRHFDKVVPNSESRLEEDMLECATDAGGGLVGALLACALALLRDDHPHRAFNAYQMNRVNLIQHLLMFCKERMLNSDCGVLSTIASYSLVELIFALLSEPLLLCHLGLLTDFLVLVHQASETFVTHSRSNFYFLLTSDTQAASEAALASLTPSLAGKRKSRRAPHKRRTDSNPSLGAAGLLLRDFSAKSSTTAASLDSDDAKPRAPSSQSSCISNDVRSEPEHLSLDSTKLEKGLANAQIKMNSQKGKRRGRSKKSSTLINESVLAYENPETLLKESVEHVPTIVPQVLANEYVVIESDEVDKGTVPMFSSGIFHQTRVRAGAAPGWTVCEGLLLLLRDTIRVMPDTMLSQVLVVVQTETLLVLGNHKDSSVRAGVLRVVCALTHRCSAEDARRLESSLYFYHLADQVSLYPASYELVSAAVSLVTKCDASLEDQLEEKVWTEVPERWLCRAPPVVALLPCTLHDVSLAYSCTLVVKKIIDKASLKQLSELGVSEVAVRCLRIVGAISDVTFEGRELVLEDLRSVLVRVAVKALQSQQYLSSVWEMHHQLSYIELMEAQTAHRERRECHVVGVARGTQCALYCAQLSCLEEKLNSSCAPHINTSNYFATVLSSAVVSITPDAVGPAPGLSQLSRAEWATRHRAVLTRAVNFIVTRDPNHMISPAEISLVERLFVVLVTAVIGSSPGLRPKWWVSVSGGDWTSVLQQLFQWLLNPHTYCELLKAFALRYIYHAPAHLQQLLTPGDPAGQRKLAVYLLSILKLLHANPSPLLETTITDWTRNWALQTQAQLADRVDSNTLADEARHCATEDLDRLAKLATPYTTINKSVFNKESLASKLTESAMSITRQVVDLQNAERKCFMQHLRRCQSEAVACAQRWRRLVDTYTHERAVWHDARSYPGSWELDPTEGPARVRVRLRRAHLDIDSKFLKEDRREKNESARRAAPLSYLLASQRSVMQSGLLDRLHMNESVHHMSRVTYVTVACEQPGELLLTDRCIHLILESGASDAASEVSGALSWSLDAVTSVAMRRWCLRERAVELFLSSGHAHLVAFHSADEMNAFLKALNSMRLPNRSESETLTEAMNLWRNGSLSNWEYLMRLNGWGGRSYNDLMQYPVLPFILADYTSKILDLTSPASYRDLSKPMAVQDRKNEMHYINNYNYLNQARREGSNLITGVNKEPYHYGSHYSNSGTVLHFLVRLPPFTRLFLNYQDNNFDIPDRTFHSLQTTWRLTSCDSTTDVKELIPEFFYLPEFFDNDEGLNLGVRQCGVAVDDVELPPWAMSARLFTLAHRQALESAHVTEHLPHWIDLVFGYKQTGQAAVDAINVFHPATYYGFEPTSIADSVERNAWETMVRTYGQTPRQLLRQPHPHAAADLHGTPNNTIPVSCAVEGARWGVYCGSPACPAPALLLARRAPYVQRLSVLPAPRAVAANTRASLVLVLPAPSRSRVTSGISAGSLAVLTWAHSDGMVRLKQRKDSPPDILFHSSLVDEITVVSSSCLRAGCAVWVGHASGRLVVLRSRSPPTSPAPHIAPARLFRRRAVEMRAHSDAVLDVFVCVAFGVAVSAGRDGLIVVWDLNKLSYVRTLPNRDALPLTCVCVSETLADVASVHVASARAGQPPHRSLLRVHTVNASFVGCVRVLEQVTCACYSTAAEGVSVNCVAAGLDTGGVRLYSSWDLRPLVYTAPPSGAAGLVSITFSVDSQQLFAATVDGTVLVWENGGGSKSSGVRILSSLNIF